MTDPDPKLFELLRHLRLLRRRPISLANLRERTGFSQRTLCDLIARAVKLDVLEMAHGEGRSTYSVHQPPHKLVFAPPPPCDPNDPGKRDPKTAAQESQAECRCHRVGYIENDCPGVPDPVPFKIALRKIEELIDECWSLHAMPEGRTHRKTLRAVKKIVDEVLTP